MSAVTAGASVPSRPWIVLRRPNGIKGADGVADAMAQAPPLTPPSRRRGLPGVKNGDEQGEPHHSPEVPQVDVGTALSRYSFQIVVGPT